MSFGRTSINRGCDQGAELTTGDPDSTFSGSNTVVSYSPLATGANGKCFDLVGLEVHAQDGNMKIGVFKDDSDKPGALLATSGSVAVPAVTGNIEYVSVTEFTADTAVVWVGVIFDDTTAKYKLGAAEEGNRHNSATTTFGAQLEDPAVAASDADTNAGHFGIKHS